MQYVRCCSHSIACLIATLVLQAPVAAHPGHAHMPTENENVECGARGVEIPFSVQMHVHGALSEGSGSMDSQTHAASETGTDVIWWTDHDWRIAAYKYATSFGFDDWTETLNANETWSISDSRETGVKAVESAAAPTADASSAVFVTTPPPFAGAASMRIEAMSGSQTFTEATWRLDAARRRFTRALASNVTCELALHPLSQSSDAHFVMRFTLSQHAPNAQLPFGQYVLEYTTDPALSSPVREGPVYRVPVAAPVGAWTPLVLDLTADASAGFPFIDGTDNNVFDITFGIRARQGGTASVCIDDLHFSHDLNSDELMVWQRDRMDALAQAHPEVMQHQGVEISYYEHLNIYGDVIPEIDYPTLIAASGYADATGYVENTKALINYSARYTVQRAHEAGALVSYNHAFGTSNELLPIPDPIEQRNLLVATRAWGADIIEVGYRQRGLDLDAFLWLWDELLGAGVPILGNGVSDTHGGTPDNWRMSANNFVTWILAPDATHASLLEALRRGRAFFGDLTLFDGSADHATPEGWHMGTIIITDRTSVDVTTTVAGLEVGDQVRVIESGVPSTTLVASNTSVSVPITISLPSGETSFVRAEVYAADGTAKVFTNPLVFLRSMPPDGLTHHRAAFDLRGYRSMHLDQLYLMDLCVMESGGANRMEMHVQALEGGATVVIDASDRGGLPASVMLAGLTGTIEVDSEAMTIAITDLVGAGTIALVDGLVACEGDANCDGLVNFHDLELVLSQWGEASPFGFQGDVTDDGAVDFDDLNAVLEFWGADCGFGVGF